MDKICKCGCGKSIEIKRYHKYYGMPNYIHGHNWKGKKQTQEHTNKIRLSLIGRKLTKEQEERRHKFPKGNIPWNKDKHHTEESKRKNSISHKGKLTWNKGKINCYSEETLKKMSDKKIGEKSPFWLGGVSHNPYDTKFNNILKRIIRKRNNYICQECNYSEQELGYKLTIHHIDYNKLNSCSENLISLCKSCHSKTNFGRNDWTNYFTKKNTKEAWSKL